MKHHAMHLDSVRKLCEANPNSFLESAPSHSVAAKKVGRTVSKQTNKAEDFVPSFDNLEEVGKAEEAGVSSNEAGFISTVMGTKESKFRI